MAVLPNSLRCGKQQIQQSSRATERSEGGRSPPSLHLWSSNLNGLAEPFDALDCFVPDSVADDLAGCETRIDVPGADELRPRFSAIVDARLTAVNASQVAGVDPEPLDRSALAKVDVEHLPASGDERSNVVEDPGQVSQGGAHRASVSTCAAPASSVMTFTHAPTALAAASAKRITGA